MAKTESKRSREAREQQSTAPLDAPPAAVPAPSPAPTPPPRKNKGGRPPAGSAPQHNRSVFSKMDGIGAEDWGTRAYVHLYRLEPFTDRLRSGNVVHIMRYHEAIEEQKVMLDHGSGRYRAILNFKKPGSDRTDEIDKVEFEILNMAYPPNVPLGEWVDDPRNKKWAWAKKMLEEREALKNAPPVQQQGARPGEVLETIRAVKELMPDPPQQNNAASTLDTIRAVRELFPAPAPQTENKMLDTVVALMSAQIASSQEEARELRKEIRERDMRQQNNPASNGIGTFKELVGTVKELLPAVKEIFPNATEAVAGAVSGRSRMNSWQEFFQPVLPELTRAIGPVLPMLVNGFLNRGPAPGVQANPGQAALPAGQRVNPLITFLNNITTPMLHYLRKYAAGDQESDGQIFAEQLFDMYGPTTPEGINWHEAAKQAGVVNLVGVYRQSPYWPQIGPIEPKFVEFLTQFLGSAPGQEDPPEAAEPEVIDLTQSEGDAELYG